MDTQSSKEFLTEQKVLTQFHHLNLKRDERLDKAQIFVRHISVKLWQRNMASNQV
ncbi:hypothetical protein RYX36_024911 [Vicia faba]